VPDMQLPQMSGRGLPALNGRRRNQPNRIERIMEQRIHVPTPFGRIMLSLVRAEPLPESARSLPQDPIDDRLANV